MSSYIDYDEDRPSLSMGERIVWISDNGPEYGNVRWLGKLPDLGKEWMAGVEFDNPVGSGTGLYHDRQLFLTPLNHASLVPVIGLLKAADFDGPPEPPSRSTSIKLIDFNNYGTANQDPDLEYAMQQSLRDSQVRRGNRGSQRSEDNHYNNHHNQNHSRTSNLTNYRTSHESIGSGGSSRSNDMYLTDRIKKLSHQPQSQQQQPHSRGSPTSSIQPNNRVRHIPIRLEEDYEPTVPVKGHVNHVNQSNSVTRPQQQPHASTPHMIKPSTSSSSNRQTVSIDSSSNPVNELLDQFNRVSLSNNSSRQQEQLPAPPVIAKQHQQPQQSQAITAIPQLPPPALNFRSNDKNSDKNLANLLGKSRGIQGHNNSCYLDATLFAMFSATTLFDSLLYRPATKNDIPKYSEIQRILREDIVRALREECFVSADKVMNFRTMLEQSSTVTGLTDEEKDPEEFLSLLLGQILKAEPYLKLSSGGESFLYQLIVDKDENVMLPTIQDLFEQSFVNSTVRLREIPPCLMLQMPRFGRHYKMYPRIMPSPILDITDVLESAPRACGHRGKDCDNIARYECKDCFGERTGAPSARLYSITYCHNCFKSKHFSKSHPTGIEDHDKTKTILDKTPLDIFMRYSNSSKSRLLYSKAKEIPRVYMDLFAVLCIETSHYVCFVKCGQDPEAPWCFFDSMADRRGEQNGYNIPEVIMFEDFSFWTSEKGRASLMSHTDDKLLPEMPRRLICDAYLCFYQYPGSSTPAHR